MTERVFAVRRAATELRAVRPELRVGLVLSAALATTAVASGVAPYLDVVWLPPDLSGDTTRIGRLYPGLGMWLARGAADPLAAGAGLAARDGRRRRVRQCACARRRTGGTPAADAAGSDATP